MDEVKICNKNNKKNNIIIKTEFLIKKFFFLNYYIINLNLTLFRAIYENNLKNLNFLNQ
jgi:hypothetical protein